MKPATLTIIKPTEAERAAGCGGRVLLNGVEVPAVEAFRVEHQVAGVQYVYLTIAVGRVILKD